MTKETTSLSICSHKIKNKRTALSNWERRFLSRWLDREFRKFAISQLRDIAKLRILKKVNFLLNYFAILRSSEL